MYNKEEKTLYQEEEEEEKEEVDHDRVINSRCWGICRNVINTMCCCVAFISTTHTL